MTPERDARAYPVIATYDGEPIHGAVSGCSTWQELAEEVAHVFPLKQIADRVCRIVFMAASHDHIERQRGFALVDTLPTAVRKNLDMYVDYPF
jgi:UDP-2,3-diacylglucosamine pyrophosphatase LpxH